MKELEDAYELIRQWGLNSDDFIAKNFQHRMYDGYANDNSIELSDLYIDSLQTIFDFGLKKAKELLDRIERHDPQESKCWYCESTLKESPNNHWWIKKTYNEGICYRCVLSLARSVLISMEKTP